MFPHTPASCQHGVLQGLLEIAEDTGMGEALRAAGLDVDKLKREAQEKLVSRTWISALAQLVVWTHLNRTLKQRPNQGAAS